MSFDFQSFLASGESFLKGVVAELDSVGVNRIELAPDHICFRVATEPEYLLYKKHLSQVGTLLIESPVNGRLISTFKLTRSFQSPVGPVTVVELSAPKPGSKYDTGFEHVEFVTTQTFADIRKRYRHLDFKESVKPINSELSLKLREGQVKFHHMTLERVIEIEKAESVDLRPSPS